MRRERQFEVAFGMESIEFPLRASPPFSEAQSMELPRMASPFDLCLLTFDFSGMQDNQSNLPYNIYVFVPGHCGNCSVEKRCDCWLTSIILCSSNR